MRRKFLPAAMPASALTAHQIFLSTVSDDFEKAGAPFPGLRSRLRFYLNRAQGQKAVAQEEFPQLQASTVQKLDDLLRPCGTVIHLVGGNPGAVPPAAEVLAYLSAHPGFLQHHPALLASLGDFTGFSYTQWEAIMALHYGKDLFIYASPHASAQQTHLDRLKLVSPKKYASPFKDEADLLGQLIGDLHTQLPALADVVRPVIAPSRILRHAPSVLFGREAELAVLDDLWLHRTGVNVYSLIAWGGAGKTSVVAWWVAKHMAAKQWPGVERYFDWSFYSQGAREQSQNNADFFIAAALAFFGDPDPQKGSAWERGERLAQLVRQHRTLLVLDGIEPLQYPPNSPQAGEFKDAALAALLQGLAMDNPGLCLVTSREPLTSLQTFHGGTAEEEKLHRLTCAAAISLLRHLQITGTDEELTAAWHDAGGHALTLQLLGRFLGQAHRGDIRRYKEVSLTEADRETPGRTAMKVLLAYENWLTSAGPERQRDLAVLRLTGLFDRPASPGCLAALRTWQFPSFFRRLFSRRWRQIYRVFSPVALLNDQQWTAALKDLEALELITLTEEADPLSAISLQPLAFTIDAHPLVREYFAQQLRTTHPEAFRAAHSRLFDHLCATTDHRPDTLAGLLPLYQAVAHGCLAGRHQEAHEKVYIDRILRGTGDGGFYSSTKLGAIGTNLGAVAAFFEEPWSRLSPNLTAPAQAWMLAVAAFSLRALGRLTEAVEPMRVGLNMRIEQENWGEAARVASNLSELEVTLGRLPEAVADARRAITFADRSGDAFQKMSKRTTAADALHQSGQQEEAAALFAEAETLQQESQPEFPLLYSLQGFQYADLLLAPAERAAWQAGVQPLGDSTRPGTLSPVLSPKGYTPTEALAACDEAARRATQTLEWSTKYLGLLDIALDHLTLARVQLYRALLAPAAPSKIFNHQTSIVNPPPNSPDSPPLSVPIPEVRLALAKLREANRSDYLPRALLTAALHAGTVGADPEAALRYLAEAEMIASRGPMPLHLADVHLHRARLGSLRTETGSKRFPTVNPRAELEKARALIERHGYHRRREELADATAAAPHWPD